MNTINNELLITHLEKYSRILFIKLKCFTNCCRYTEKLLQLWVSVESFSRRAKEKMATRCRSHRLFDLLILAPDLLGLVDPLTLVLWQSLQVQLQTASAQVSACDLNKKLHKQAETRLSVSTKEGLQAARTAVFSAAGKIAKATLIKPNRTS